MWLTYMNSKYVQIIGGAERAKIGEKWTNGSDAENSNSFPAAVRFRYGGGRESGKEFFGYALSRALNIHQIPDFKVFTFQP